MYLKKLVIAGFKSFADRTEFAFEPGITGLVGPNGCGKSNVVDAMKWILGEQSAKSLRGGAMQDVIFNGGSGRKPTAFAEASLTLAGARGALSTEHDEITVTRRLYRNGDSEYLMNQSPCRLKDIRNLFYDTGIGTSTYSFIEQGRVDMLLNANSQERRIVFEEAAGISKYKARKREAVSRLERVDQNLLRLTDIVAEVAKQLRGVRIQAGRARKYQDYSRLLRARRIVLSLSRYEELHRRHGDFKQLSEQLGDRVNGRVAEIDQLEARESALQLALTELDERIRAAQRRSMEVADAIAATRGQIDTHRSLLAELARQNESLEQARRGQAERAERLSTESADARQSRDRLQEAFNSDHSELERLQGEALHAQGRQEALSAAVEQLKAGLIDILRENSNLQNRLGALQSRRQTLAAQLEQLESKRQNLDARHAENTAIRAEMAQRDDALRGQLDEKAADIERLETEYASLTESAAAERRRLAEKREALSSASARLELLQDMKRQHEGLAAGARTIIERSAERPFETGATLGLLAERIAVPPQHVHAVEAALGELAQAIVVENTATADGMAEFLRAEDAGRATLLALDAIGAGPAPADIPEGAQRLASVVECDAALRGLVDALLGHTLLVDSIDAARRAQRMAAGRVAAVTASGDLVGPTGALTAGAPGKAGGLIGRMTEMTQLNERLTALSAETERLETEAARLERQAFEAGLGRRAAAEQRDRLAKEHHTLERDISRTDETLRALTEERTVIASEREALSAGIEQSVVQEAELSEALAELSTRQDAATQHISERTTEAERLAREAREAADRLNGARIEQARRRQELTSAQERLRNLEAAVRDLDVQQRATAEQIADNTRRQDESRHRLDEARPELGRLEEQATDAAHAIETLDADRGRQRKDLTGVTENLHAKRTELHTLEGELQDSRIQENESRFQMEGLATRIADEYGENIARIYAGVSAFERAAAEAGLPHPHELPEDQQEAAMARMDALAAEVDEPIRPYLDWRHQVGNPDELNREVEDLRERIRKLGNVNLDAINDEEALQERHDFLEVQQRDLQQAKAKLEEVIERINVYSRNRFLEIFTSIRANFQETFRKLFGGGRADIMLENEDDPLDSGIEIVARPPGKENRSISLLSGGEKTMTTVALLFAIFKTKPSPFCVLDEVDAALDEANIDRFIGMLQEFLDESQFLIVTHSKRTMSAAGTIYGVTMQQSGVSKKIAVTFEQSRRETPGESGSAPEGDEEGFAMDATNEAELATERAEEEREAALVEGG